MTQFVHVRGLGEGITDTGGSGGLRNVSAIAASACSALSRSMIGTIRSRFRPTRLRASVDVATHRHRAAAGIWARGVRQPRAGADEIERWAAVADLARRGTEVAGVDPGDSLREVGLERRRLGPLRCPRHHGVRPLEEVIDDLDLRGPGAEAGERIDEALE